jgi:hypothetical protein
MTDTSALFDTYLADTHAELFPEVLDDDMPDHFENWVTGLEPEEVIIYANLALDLALRLKTK